MCRVISETMITCLDIDDNAIFQCDKQHEPVGAEIIGPLFRGDVDLAASHQALILVFDNSLHLPGIFCGWFTAVGEYFDLSVAVRHRLAAVRV